MKRFIIVLLAFIVQSIISTAFSQNIIKGKVEDAKTKEALELAVVTDIKTQNNILTNREGVFTLKNISEGDSIRITFIGYASKTIIAGNQKQPLIIDLLKGTMELSQVIITTHQNNLTTSRLLTAIDLNMQPVKSAQDLMRLIPGLFIAQHQGGGKAEQIFLRGFDADHGTDVNVSVDGLPVNLVSQAHGQGYADLHFVIPETIAGYDFGKGPYYASKGDFCTAGYVAYNTKNVLDTSMVKIEAGMYNTIRGVAMFNLLSEKAKEKGQSAYVAGEALYSDGGPFDVPEQFNRFNIFGKFITPINSKSKLNIILSSMTSRWKAAGEIPNRAQAEGYIQDAFGSIDSFQGGYVTRANANIRLTSQLGNNTTFENQVFYSHCYFNLISNFTFYYADPVNGDEFGQHEKRDLYGYKSTLTHQNFFANATLTSSVSAGIRYDHTNPSWLSHTFEDSILNFIQLGIVKEADAYSYIDETLESGKWLFNVGARFDYFNFYYLSTAPVSDTAAIIYNGVNTTQGKSIVSPKINIQYTLSSKIQLYVKTGKGFHSNDARVVIANEGYEILPAAYGADLGMNWKPAPRLFINTALWYLYLQQEFTYGADFGNESVQPGGKTVRKGVDFSMRYQINNWLYTNLNLDYADPKFLDSAAGHQYLPLAPTFTSTAGLFVKFKNGFNGGISYRYLHDRAANNTYTLTAKGYFITDLSANYRLKKYEIGLGIENLFNQAWNEAQFEYVSQLKGEKAPVDEVSNTPGVPFFARLKLTVFL